MARTIHVLSEAAARQYGDNTRRLERTPRGQKGMPTGQRLGPLPQLASVRVTSTSTTDGYYPAEVVVWNSTAKTWGTPLATGQEAVWLYFPDAPGSIATNDVFPVCLVIGTRPADDKLIFAEAGAEGISEGGGSITVEEQDGSPSYSSITTIQFNQADGCVVTNPSAGTALVSIQDASASVVGIVSTGTQTFAGNKTFTGNVSSNADITAYENIGGGTSYVSLQDLSGSPAVFFVAPSAQTYLSVGTGSGFQIVNSGGPITYDTQDGQAHRFRGTLTGSPKTPVMQVYHTGDAAYRTGAAGTDALGNVFTSGLCTTVGSTGASGTVTLAKITGGGTDGSLTFTNGVCTSITAPT